MQAGQFDVQFGDSAVQLGCPAIVADRYQRVVVAPIRVSVIKGALYGVGTFSTL